MNNIEVIICLLLLFMAVPDVCRNFGRPALVYPVFVVFGLLISPLADREVQGMIKQAGEVGFLLLLFEVGLEIELPRWKEFLRPLRYAAIWSLAQYPIIIALARFVGLGTAEALPCAASLTGCSVGMAYAGWKQYTGLSGSAKPFVLEIMVAMEMLAIVAMAVDTAALEHGLTWLVLFKLAGIFTVIFLVSQFSGRLNQLFQRILEMTTHWRVHLIVLLVLAVCALGERLGLSASKTAFFLGLFMSHAEHHGKNIEQAIAPISQRFLIPLFFVALGLRVETSMLFSLPALIAAGSAMLLFAAREVLHRRWLPTGGDQRAFLLFCPNLSLVALAATILLENHSDPQGAFWVVATGLILSVLPLCLLPPTQADPLPKPPSDPASAVPPQPA